MARDSANLSFSNIEREAVNRSIFDRRCGVQLSDMDWDSWFRSDRGWLDVVMAWELFGKKIFKFDPFNSLCDSLRAESNAKLEAETGFFKRSDNGGMDKGDW